MRTLYRNAVVYTPAYPEANALLVDGDRIGWLGDFADAPPADVVVNVEGDVITPAFVDAHLHATDTGLTLMGLDLSGANSAADILTAVERYASGVPADMIVLGHGWDESGWADPSPPTARELDRAARGRPVYLSRVDAHSALASTALLAAVPASVAGRGYDSSGWLRQEAHHSVRLVALGSVGSTQRHRAQITALRAAAATGIAAVCECGGPEISDESDFAEMLALADSEGVPEIFGYWGELGSARKAREMGAIGAAGDLFADGAVGSRTAHVREPYVDGGGNGYGYLTVEQVCEHVVGCARERIQAGFHAIGDAALDTVLAGFSAAEGVLGRDRLRAGHHRIEHAELLDRPAIAAMVEYGLIASVQPAFDRLWGGDRGMYALRLGSERAQSMNPFAELAGVGVTLAFGSDSPVTAMDPWGALVAAMDHHNPAQRLGQRAAFAAHTRGGWRAVGHDDEGMLLPGGTATFAVWHAPGGVVDGGLPRLVSSEQDVVDLPKPVCRRTVSRGAVIFEDSLGGGPR